MTVLRQDLNTHEGKKIYILLFKAIYDFDLIQLNAVLTFANNIFFMFPKIVVCFWRHLVIHHLFLLVFKYTLLKYECIFDHNISFKPNYDFQEDLLTEC